MRSWEAFKACYNGKRVARRWWDYGTYVYYTHGKTFEPEQWYGDDCLTGHESSRGFVVTSGHFDLHDADDVRTIGWLPSQTDLVSDDWYVIE